MTHDEIVAALRREQWEYCHQAASAMERYRELIERWKGARKTVVGASIYPVGNEAYKVALNELSEAEAALNDTELKEETVQ